MKRSEGKHKTLSKKKNIEIDNLGKEAFKEGITEIENRLKTFEDEEASIER
jgi:hypothetical protein